MTDREQKILAKIIENYIDTARPVGSKLLADSRLFPFSPATIRAAMAELENFGFIDQPHTSAGRIPTIKGYRYYLDNLLDVKPVADKELQELQQAIDTDLRDLAKLLSDKTKLASIVYSHPNSFYFTGLFNLFSQAEFENYQLVLNMSQVVDSLEKTLSPLFKKVDKLEVFLGNQNPVSPYCSVAILPLPRQHQILSVIGPTRMDYSRALSLLDGVLKITQ